MPDISNTERLEQIRQQIDLVKKPGGAVPVHPNLVNAVDLIALLLDEWHVPEAELDQLRAALEQLRTDLQANADADGIERGRTDSLIAETERLANRLAELTASVDENVQALQADLAAAKQQADTDRAQIEQNKTDIQALQEKDSADDERHQFLLAEIARLEALIAGSGLTEADVQALLAPLQEAVNALQQQDVVHGEQIAGLLADIARLDAAIQEKIAAGDVQALIDAAAGPLDARITVLENRPTDGGLSEADVRRIATEELASVKQDIQALQAQNLLDEQRIQNLLQRVEALERQPPGEGISEAEVRRIMGEETQKIRAEINLLKIELQGEIALKADKADLVLKADKAELVAHKIDVTEQLALKATKSDVSDLEADLEQQLGTKADKTEVAGLKTDLEAQIELKADQTALDSCKADIETQLGTKADKTEVADLKTDLEAQIELKADQTALEACKADIETQLGDKADKTEVADLKTDLEAQIGLKADQTALDACKADIETQLDTKADKTEVADLKTDLEAQIELKADQTALDACKADIETQLDTKADKTEVADLKTDLEAQIELKADQTALDACKADIETKLNTKADKTELADAVEELKEEWLKESQNGPGARLARICLQGWGIVGGLDIRSDDKDYICITPGIGVTPNGTLVVEPMRPAQKQTKKKGKKTDDDCADVPAAPPMGVLVFSHAVLYDKAGEYAFFHKSNGDGVYEVWELLEPSDDLPDDARPLTPQDDDEYSDPFIRDKIILLLPDGPVRRYLLMKREDLLEKTSALAKCKPKNPNTDYTYSEAYSPYDDQISDDDLWLCLHPAARLPEIPLYRFGYFQDKDCDPADLDITDFPDLASVHDFYKTWVPIIEDAFGSLERALDTLVKRYHPTLFPLLEEQHFHQQAGILWEKWTKFVGHNAPPKVKESDVRTKYYAQYFYDWARDLIAAYHELRLALIELMNDLRPYTAEMLAQQHQHLVLGPANQPDSAGVDAVLRDYFRQPPIYNGNAARLETCRLYYRRIFEMLEGFYLEGYVKHAKTPGWCEPDNDDVTVAPDFSRLRITPGKGYFHPLSQQSIPFYYPLNDSAGSLQHYWNYHRTKTRSTDRILSYHATDTPPDFPSYTRRREVIRPLYYSLDPHDFYRVEGHIGKYEVALYGPNSEQDIPQKFSVVEALEFLVRKYNLDFKVLPVSIGDLQKQKNGQPPYRIGTTTDLRYRGQSFALDLLGAEHLAGVPKGGTFIVVMADLVVDGQTRKVAVADFALPYRCCTCAEPPKTCALDMAIAISKACDNGQRLLSIAVTPSNPTGTAFNLFLDGKPWGQAPVPYPPDGPAVVEMMLAADGEMHVVRVQDAANSACFAEQTFVLPACGGDCALDIVAKVAGNCNPDTGMVPVEIVVKAQFPSGPGFHLLIEGKPVDGSPFKYQPGADTTVVPISLLGSGATLTIQAIDINNQQCSARTTLEVPPCFGQLT